MLLPVKTWEIASLACRTSKTFFRWSKMRIFCLTWVKSSLVGSAQIDSLPMSPSSSDRGSYFTIKSSRLMGSFNFLAFVQPQSFRGDFYFSLRAMTLYSTYWFVGNVCRLFAQFYEALRMSYGFCVCLCTAFLYVYGFYVHFCTDFAHVVRLLRTYMAYFLHKLCGFCVHIRIFVLVDWICVCIRLIFVYVWCKPSQGIWSSGFFYLLFSVRTLVICWNSWWSNLEGYLIFYCSCERSWLVESLDYPILRVIFPRELFVMIGPSQESDL